LLSAIFTLARRCSLPPRTSSSCSPSEFDYLLQRRNVGKDPSINAPSAIKFAGFLATALCSWLCLGQEVQVAPAKGGITLSVPAEGAYELMPGETKLPVLSLECLHKSKKSAHLLIFAPGGEVSQRLSANAPESFVIKVNGTKQASIWTPYGDASSFAYAAKTETERMQFIQSVLNSGTVSFDFRPFLTGVATTAVFNVSKLREEVNKHPECSTQ
jgi:hypothetical protein